METLSVLLISLAVTAVIMSSVCIGCVCLGYWMGRNSTERPLLSDQAEPLMQPNDNSDDVGADVFDEAMQPEEDKNERIPTMQ